MTTNGSGWDRDSARRRLVTEALDGRDLRGNCARHRLPLRMAWSALRHSGDARVVAYSSIGHRVAGMDFDDPNFNSRPDDKWVAYGQSKTATSLFAVELDSRAQEYGVRAFAVHPGAVLTDLLRFIRMKN